MTPARGKCFVRPVETPEMLTGGRIILTERTREDLTSHQMEVVSVGLAAWCDNPDCERPHAHPPSGVPHTHYVGVTNGDWVLIAHRSLIETDEPNLFCCAQDNLLAVLHAS